MRSDLFKPEYQAQPPTAPGMSLQHAKAIKYVVNGECHARQGSMVAFRGNLQFEVKSQGVGNFLRRAVTGEGLPLMAVRGQGEVWFAHNSQNCFVMDLDQPGEALSINGRNVLCFDPTLSYEIKMVGGAGMTGGGLFNCLFTGQGRIGLISDGEPIIIPVSAQAPVYVDTDAVVGWSANLHTSINQSQSFGSMLRGGSGEAMQLALQGEGFVIVQPSELKPPPGQ
ncbi:AIM24 family protein [Streptomyces millisiae]|uniref:AIM24 family protein n=1 Tax=Streptomyces millisiae TaxID=3075542 RepID=A0ABU2LPV7_9ACTN|nr:AIM24 family protein [Streptomyces sp. DSM 44918]MDT0319622.1 AIM24 family protein [Streptomyces sp. DSM 44918]